MSERMDDIENTKIIKEARTKPSITNKLQELKKPIRFKWRAWQWNKAKTKISVLWYIDSRDAQDRLDEIFWMDREDEYKEIDWTLFCGVTIEWKTRWDCWTESNVEKDKWEASDAFKRACVKRWLGRFLYTLPRLYLTAEEEKANKWDITEFVKKKYNTELKKRYEWIIWKKEEK